MMAMSTSLAVSGSITKFRLLTASRISCSLIGIDTPGGVKCNDSSALENKRLIAAAQVNLPVRHNMTIPAAKMP